MQVIEGGRRPGKSQRIEMLENMSGALVEPEAAPARNKKHGALVRFKQPDSSRKEV